MARKLNPLLTLAWAGLSEKAIIGRVANKLTHSGVCWTYGYQCDVKEAVKDSCPPRGQFKPRLEAVIKELSKQASCISLRARYTYAFDYLTEKGTFSDRRCRAMSYRLNEQVYKCNILRRIGKTLIYVGQLGRYNHNLVLALLRQGKRTIFRIDSINISLAQILLHNFDMRLLPTSNRHVLESWLEQGAKMSFDFDTYATNIEHPDGRKYRINWLESERLVKQDDLDD